MLYDTKRHDMVVCDSIERLIVDQEVPGSRPGGGTITFNRLSHFTVWMQFFLQKLPRSLPRLGDA